MSDRTNKLTYDKMIDHNYILIENVNDELTSCNLELRKVIGELKELLGDKPLVLDREFSYEDCFPIWFQKVSILSSD